MSQAATVPDCAINAGLTWLEPVEEQIDEEGVETRGQIIPVRFRRKQRCDQGGSGNEEITGPQDQQMEKKRVNGAEGLAAIRFQQFFVKGDEFGVHIPGACSRYLGAAICQLLDHQAMHEGGGSHQRQGLAYVLDQGRLWGKCARGAMGRLGGDAVCDGHQQAGSVTEIVSNEGGIDAGFLGDSGYRHSSRGQGT